MSETGKVQEEADDQARKWVALQAAVEARSIGIAVEFFRSNGLEPVMFKGAAAGRNYPAEKFRFSTDIDLAFSAADFDKAFQLAQREDYKGLVLDIHREFKHLDTVDWDVIVKRSQVIDIGNTNVTVPSDEDHLRLLCVHWLVDGGYFRERLWDIYYAVDNRSANFDWSICLDQVSAVRRRWIICAIGMAHHYLQLDVDGLPFADEAKRIPGWMIRAVEKEWASGVRLMPIQQFAGRPSMFFSQLKKRLPPNPITATLDVDGSLDSRFQFHYQLGSMLKRLGPSLRKFRAYFSR